MSYWIAEIRDLKTKRIRLVPFSKEIKKVDVKGIAIKNCIGSEYLLVVRESTKEDDPIDFESIKKEG